MLSKIEAPIVVIGLGRSGSTLFHRMLAAEKSLQWFCQALEKKPGWPAANKLLMSMRGLPAISSLLERRLEPVEAYAFWDRAFPGFRSPCRDLTSADVNDRITAQVHTSLAQTINADLGQLLLKITGWPRIGCVKSLFPDACLVHVKRDPRAVINSLLQVPWWRGWNGPTQWRWGELTEGDHAVWLRHNQSFVALAAIQCRIYQRAYNESVACLPAGSIFEVRYDELCRDPREQMVQVFEHAKLVWSSQFERKLSEFSVRNTDYKFSEQLSKQQIATLESTLDELDYES